MNERFKPYFEEDSAVLPLTDGYKYTEQQYKTYSADSTRDISLMDSGKTFLENQK